MLLSAPASFGFADRILNDFDHITMQPLLGFFLRKSFEFMPMIELVVDIQEEPAVARGVERLDARLVVIFEARLHTLGGIFGVVSDTLNDMLDHACASPFICRTHRLRRHSWSRRSAMRS